LTLRTRLIFTTIIKLEKNLSSVKRLKLAFV